MAIQADKSEATKKRIIDVARQMFAEKGFADTALDDIVARANVTTGAIYHHFGGKKGLFIAVAEYLEEVILDQLASRILPGCSPWDVLESGLLGTLEICAQPDIQRIVFSEAPNVIGPSKWREIEMRYAFGLMRSTIQQLSMTGAIDAPDPDLTAQILLGAIIEAAHGIALSDDSDAALVQAKLTVGKMLRALKLD